MSSWINIPNRFEYRIIEDLGKNKNGWNEKIIRSISFKTIKEAEEKMSSLTPKENGTLKIEKVFMM